MAAYTDTPNRAINAETYFASFGASGSDGRLQTDGDVMLAEYQPETERYGGVQAIAAAETVFVESAEIARAVIESTHGKINQRHAIAADLVLVFAHAMGFSAPDTLQQVRNYFYGWDISTETTPVRPRWLVAAARSAFAQNPDYWAARWDLLAAKLADAAEDAYTLWGMAIRRFRQTLENLDLQPAAINRATWSQQHMLMNRLGVSVLDERKIMWLIGLGIEARLRMRIDSAIAGDAYLATTRSPRIMDHCNPILDVDQFTRNHELISLQPTGIRTEVYTTLLTRRSRTSGYRASLTFEKLGNLSLA